MDAAGYGGTITAGNCYTGSCSIQRVTGDLPGGYVRPGGPVTVQAYIENPTDVPWNDPLPAVGSRLVLQSDAGDYSFVSYPGGIGPHSGRTVTFTTTAPNAPGATTTLSARMAYAYNFFFGASCQASIYIYPPPLVVADGAQCLTPSVYGWAFAPMNPSISITVEVYADGPRGSGSRVGNGLAAEPRPDVNAYFGIGGNHGYNITLPQSLQDGRNHTFYVYAIDPYGVQDGGPATVTMQGCGRFILDPQVPSAGLYRGSQATIENPDRFCMNMTVTATYPGWNGPPPPSGVPTSTHNFSFTRNGGTVGGGQLPSNFINFAHVNNEDCVGVPQPPTPGDLYCGFMNVDPTQGLISNTGQILRVDYGLVTIKSACSRIVNEPYVKFYGQGPAAGGAFSSTSTTGSCSIDTGNAYTGAYNGLLASWNDNTAASGSPNRGSGSQLSALALIKITGLASAQTVAGPTGRTFANAGVAGSPSTSIDSPTLGGEFVNQRNGYTNCLTEPQPPAGATALGGGSVNVASLGSGAYTVTSGNLILNGGSIAPGRNIAIYVSNRRHVYVNGNITYQDSGWSTTTVPSFTLVVAGGNIYVGNNVTQMDGAYVAVNRPDGGDYRGRGGVIYDCTDRGLFSPANNDLSNEHNNAEPLRPEDRRIAGVPYSNLGGSVFGDCKNQLTVHGSFVANWLSLQRTYGSMRNATSGDNPRSGGARACSNAGAAIHSNVCAAEIFDFSPEMYIAHPPVSLPNNGTPQWQAITSLPPVL